MFSCETMEEESIICDVCSKVLQQDDIPFHIQLHTSQLARLCKMLTIPTFEVNDKTSDDTEKNGLGYGTTEDCPLADESDQISKQFECPDKTCNHRVFGRKQDLIRHFMKHCEINRLCDCGKHFCFANTYVSHKHEQEPDQKRTAKERFQQVHDHVKASLEKAQHSRKISKGLPSSRRQKKRKTETLRDSQLDPPRSPPYLTDQIQPLDRGAAPFGLRAGSDQSGSVNGHVLLSQVAAEEATLFVLPTNSSRPNNVTGVDGNNQLHFVSDYLPVSPTQQAIPSQPPIIWEMAAWNLDSVNGQATF